MDLRSTYNKIAEDWHRDHQSDDWWVPGVEKFISLLPTGASILDVGCGAGVKARYMTERGLKVTGIDFAEKLIEIARGEVPNARFITMDLFDIVKLKDRFDGVFTQAVLLHIPKQKISSILRLLGEKLKPGGYLYLAVKEIRNDQPEEEIVAEEDYGYHYERFFSYFSLPEIEKHLTLLAFTIVYKTIVTSGKGSWIQVIARK